MSEFNTKEELAALITGREYRNELTKYEIGRAKEIGLVVVTGYSDDILRFEGAISDEVSAYEGITALVHPGGVLGEWHSLAQEGDEENIRAYLKEKDQSQAVQATWSPDFSDLSWRIDSPIPHAKFTIFDDGEPYCEGIVFDMKDLRAMVDAKPTVDALQAKLEPRHG